MIGSGRAIPSQVVGGSTEELSALPIWAFTLGIFALLTFGLTAVPSIVCGHLALAQRQTARRDSLGKSVALVGLVIGYLGIGVLITWSVVLARHLLH
jgi:hypothetical protein